MRETLTRRIKHGELPDLFIVDGGSLQVNIFLDVLKEFGLVIPVVGIAKSRTKISRSEYKKSKQKSKSNNQ